MSAEGELPPEIHALLDVERVGEDVPPELAERLGRRLAATLRGGGDGGDGGDGGGGGAPGPVNAAGGASTASWLSSAGLVGLGAVVGVVGHIAWQDVSGDASRSPRGAERGPAAALEPTPAVPEEPVEAPAQGETLEPEPEPEPKPRSLAVVSRPIARRRPAPMAAPPSDPPATEDGRSLLAQARAALARGLAEEALAALFRHHQLHPSGTLREEREALHVRALAAAGRQSRARQEAAIFLARYPQSLFRQAVEEAIGGR